MQSCWGFYQCLSKVKHPQYGEYIIYSLYCCLKIEWILRNFCTQGANAENQHWTAVIFGAISILWWKPLHRRQGHFWKPLSKQTNKTKYKYDSEILPAFLGLKLYCYIWEGGRGGGPPSLLAAHSSNVSVLDGMGMFRALLMLNNMHRCWNRWLLFRKDLAYFSKTTFIMYHIQLHGTVLSPGVIQVWPITQYKYQTKKKKRQRRLWSVELQKSCMKNTLLSKLQQLVSSGSKPLKRAVRRRGDATQW